MIIIDGHGGGCVGCAHPPKNLKSPDTPPCRRQRGCAPYGVGLSAKKKFSHPGVGGAKKISAPWSGAEIFLGFSLLKF